MRKIKPSTLMASIAKSSFKRTSERLVEKYNTFTSISSVKRAPAYWKQFLCNVLARNERCNLLNNNAVLIARHFQY